MPKPTASHYTNKQLAETFPLIGDLLEIKGEIIYKTLPAARQCPKYGFLSQHSNTNDQMAFCCHGKNVRNGGFIQWKMNDSGANSGLVHHVIKNREISFHRRPEELGRK
jgi:hypothetical protein